jgi:hypothetical protein
MSTMNISLPDTLKKFVDEQVAVKLKPVVLREVAEQDVEDALQR